MLWSRPFAFLEASPSPELLEFEDFDFEEAHCRALATLERTGLEVTFHKCTLDAEGAKDTFIEWLRHSQVVTKLTCCSFIVSISLGEYPSFCSIGRG
jgi:hypothetical protein